MERRAIATRFERKHVIATGLLAVEKIALDGGVVAYSGIGGYATRACGIGLDGPVGEAVVDGLVAFLEARGEEATVEVTPFTDPSLVRLLGERGFVIKYFADVHALPLTAEAPAVDVPEGIRIERLDRADDVAVRAAAEHNEREFAPGGSVATDVAVALTMKALRQATTDAFIARDGAAIAGVGCMSTTDGLSVLFGAATSAAYRRRGIQTALMRARVAAAVERGSDLACVVTAPGIATERNAARLGFAMAYTRVVLRRPRPP